MFKKIALALVVVVAGFAAFVATRPSTYRVERSIVIAAPADLPYGLVNDLHRWHFWSPWDEMDPKMKKTFDGAYAGPGAIYAWEGNDKVGKGKMTILESQPYDSIRIQLEFIEPWAGTNITSFLFQKEAEGVKVTWRMDGNNNFMGKAFSLFLDMDGMIGADFEKGLGKMKSLTEQEAKNRLEREARMKAREAEKAAEAATTTP